jgi:predicted aspartyl protease
MEQINLNPANKQAHLDIEHEIARQKNGVFTMSLRINGKQIVDIIFREIWKPT